MDSVYQSAIRYRTGWRSKRTIEKGRQQNSADCILPPLSNGITVKHGNTDTRHRARPDFLASICSNGNDFQHAKYVVILSSPNASAGAFSVIEENFEKALTLHAVKKIPKQTWLKDRNQFLIPLPSVCHIFFIRNQQFDKCSVTAEQFFHLS